MVPVAQKEHAWRHPTCDETHRVEKPSDLAEAGVGMMTVSTASPFSSSIRSLCVPHAEVVERISR